jgi:hypothetical protein
VTAIRHLKIGTRSVRAGTDIPSRDTTDATGASFHDRTSDDAGANPAVDARPFDNVGRASSDVLCAHEPGQADRNWIGWEAVAPAMMWRETVSRRTEMQKAQQSRCQGWL